MSQADEYVVVRDPGCWDMFPGSYTQSQWKAMRSRPREMLQILKYNQTGFLATQLIHVAIFLVWCLATRVPGFNLYDGSEAANANTHSGWWLMADAMVLIMGLLAPYFTLHYIREGNYEKVETAVKGTASWLLAYQIVAVLGAVMAVVHVILSMFELRQCSSSTLCQNYYWMQIALIVLLWILVILLLWSAGLAGTFRANIQGAVAWGGLRPTVMVSEISADAPSAPTLEQVTIEATGTKAQIMTPLLQMRLQNAASSASVPSKIRHTAGARTLVGMK